MHHTMFGHGFWGPVFWFVVVGAIIAGLIWFFRTSRANPNPDDKAEEILKTRYAQGDIDQDEYRRRLAEIKA